MLTPTWLWDTIFSNQQYSFAVINDPTFLKSEDAGHILKSEVVSLSARTALSWDWRIPR